MCVYIHQNLDKREMLLMKVPADINFKWNYKEGCHLKAKFTKNNDWTFKWEVYILVQTSCQIHCLLTIPNEGWALKKLQCFCSKRAAMFLILLGDVGRVPLPSENFRGFLIGPGATAAETDTVLTWNIWDIRVCSLLILNPPCIRQLCEAQRL